MAETVPELSPAISNRKAVHCVVEKVSMIKKSDDSCSNDYLCLKIERRCLGVIDKKRVKYSQKKLNKFKFQTLSPHLSWTMNFLAYLCFFFTAVSAATTGLQRRDKSTVLTDLETIEAATVFYFRFEFYFFHSYWWNLENGGLFCWIASLLIHFTISCKMLIWLTIFNPRY